VTTLVERILYTRGVTAALEGNYLPELLAAMKENNDALILWMRGDHEAGVRNSA